MKSIKNNVNSIFTPYFQFQKDMQNNLIDKPCILRKLNYMILLMIEFQNPILTIASKSNCTLIQLICPIIH